jgi:hypothetical protein
MGLGGSGRFTAGQFDSHQATCSIVMTSPTSGIRWPNHDMLPMIPVMARATKHLGFGVIRFRVHVCSASQDHITGG